MEPRRVIYNLAVLFKQAIEISPNSSDVHLGLDGWFVVMGRYEDMVKEAQIAVQLDPLSC